MAQKLATLPLSPSKQCYKVKLQFCWKKGLKNIDFAYFALINLSSVGKFSAVKSLRTSSKRERKNMVGLHTKTIFKCTWNSLPSKFCMWFFCGNGTYCQHFLRDFHLRQKSHMWKNIHFSAVSVNLTHCDPNVLHLKHCVSFTKQWKF